ncbi:MAG: hypothetical protein H0T60_03175, partial [Acidobacteria bacterium]|nr:hypothetical protein [Acidobacteriota bacterium]
MIPLTRAIYTLTIFALAVGLLNATPAAAQNRHTRPRRTRSAQAKPQPSPRPAPTLPLPLRPVDQQLYEQDQVVLGLLSEDSRAA